MNIKDMHGPILGDIEAAIQRGLFTGAGAMKKTTSKEILRRPKGGITYYRKDKNGKRRKHIASAPGETHANMTGALRKSLSFKILPMKIEFGYGLIKDDAPEYAGAIEFGYKFRAKAKAYSAGRTRSRKTREIKPRPSLQNGAKDSRANIIDTLEQEIFDAII